MEKSDLIEKGNNILKIKTDDEENMKQIKRCDNWLNDYSNYCLEKYGKESKEYEESLEEMKYQKPFMHIHNSKCKKNLEYRIKQIIEKLKMEN